MLRVVAREPMGVDSRSGALSFAHFAKGGYHASKPEALSQKFCFSHTSQTARRMGHPTFELEGKKNLVEGDQSPDPFGAALESRMKALSEDRLVFQLLCLLRRNITMSV